MKRWYSTKRGANGVTTVTCSLQDGSLSVRFAVKSFSGGIKSSVAEARAGAEKTMIEMKEATKDDFDDE